MADTHILDLMRSFVLTGDLKAALFLSQCMQTAKQSEAGAFTRTYQEWQEELGLNKAEINRCRKQAARWVTTELENLQGEETLRCVVDLRQIASDLEDIR